MHWLRSSSGTPSIWQLRTTQFRRPLRGSSWPLWKWSEWTYPSSSLVTWHHNCGRLTDFMHSTSRKRSWTTSITWVHRCSPSRNWKQLRETSWITHSWGSRKWAQRTRTHCFCSYSSSNSPCSQSSKTTFCSLRNTWWIPREDWMKYRRCGLRTRVSCKKHIKYCCWGLQANSTWLMTWLRMTATTCLTIRLCCGLSSKIRQRSFKNLTSSSRRSTQWRTCIWTTKPNCKLSSTRTTRPWGIHISRLFSRTPCHLNKNDYSVMF